MTHRNKEPLELTIPQELFEKFEVEAKARAFSFLFGSQMKTKRRSLANVHNISTATPWPAKNHKCFNNFISTEAYSLYMLEEQRLIDIEGII